MQLTAKHKDTEEILISRDDLKDAWVAKKLCQIVYENHDNRINEKAISVTCWNRFKKHVVGAEGRICQIVNKNNKLLNLMWV